MKSDATNRREQYHRKTHAMKICRYIRIPTLQELRHPRVLAWNGCGIFRNLPHIKPGRWGVYFFCFEVGSRDPGDPIGLWLKRLGLWPW